MNSSRLRIGLIVNPCAGVGGPAGLRGSDGVYAQAIARGAQPRAGERARQFLRALAPQREHVVLLAWAGAMGADAARSAGWPVEELGSVAGETAAGDTIAAARALRHAGVDLLLFAGGDGTARDICAAVGDSVPVLGIPAGVKMYSGVFAVSPEAAAEVVARLVQGRPVSISPAEVRDIDEAAFRADRVASRRYGELRCPGVAGFVQHIKCGTPPDEAQARTEIGSFLAETLEPGALYLVGTGSTPKALLAALGLEGSLLGIDALCDGRLLGSDLLPAQMLDLLARHERRHLVLTATDGQGFLIGRGNQQLTPEVLRAVGPAGLLLVATPGKLARLDGRPLLVDSGDPALDVSLAGLREVVTGYEQAVLYRVQPAWQTVAGDA